MLIQALRMAGSPSRPLRAGTPCIHHSADIPACRRTEIHDFLSGGCNQQRPCRDRFRHRVRRGQPTRRQSLYKNAAASPRQRFKGFLKIGCHFTEIRRNECFHMFVAALKEERQREQCLFDIQRQQQFSNVRKVFIILAQNHAIGAQRHVLVLQVDNSV